MKSPLDRMPPFLCRAYAHVSTGGHSRPKRVAEIAKDARMSVRSVKRISRRVTWWRLREDMIFGFATACGVDLLNPGQVISEMKHSRKRSHWRKNPHFYAGLFAEAKAKLNL